jgi:hypothetical protein
MFLMQRNKLKKEISLVKKYKYPPVGITIINKTYIGIIIIRVEIKTKTLI